MGLNLLGNSGKSVTPPNPDPSNYKIKCGTSYKRIKDKFRKQTYITVLEVYYPGCTTHKGIKILVYEASLEFLNREVRLDPHFLDSGISPIARFPATEEGRKDAEAFAKWKAKHS